MYYIPSPISIAPRLRVIVRALAFVLTAPVTLSGGILAASPSVACCGEAGPVKGFDFNGDGYADLAVGVPDETVSGFEDAGAVNVIYGSATGLTATGNQQWSLDSPGIFGVAASEDLFGLALTSADFNGDGFADLAVGAPQESVEVWLAGAVHVLYGSASGLTATGNQMFSQDSAGIVGTSEVNDAFGLSLAAGDPGNGGYDDLVIGAPGEALEPRGFPAISHAGDLHVIYGSSTGLTSVGNQSFNQDSAGIQDSAEPVDYFADELTVANVGGDSTGDLIVGVPAEDLGSVDSAGVVHVILGSSTGLVSAGNTLWSQDSAGVPGTAEAGDSFGSSIAAADFGGTTAKELAIGVPGESYASGAIDDGVVQVLIGGASGLTATGSQLWNQSTAGVLETAESKDFFGSSLAVGNLGNDARSDLAIGAVEDLYGPADSYDGVVQTLYGGTAGLSATGNQLWHQDVAGVPDDVEDGDRFGGSLQVGNFGVSSQDDLAAGGIGETVNLHGSAGAVTVMYGASGGLTATGSQLWTQDSANIIGASASGEYFGYLTKR